MFAESVIEEFIIGGWDSIRKWRAKLCNGVGTILASCSCIDTLDDQLKLAALDSEKEAEYGPALHGSHESCRPACHFLVSAIVQKLY